MSVDSVLPADPGDPAAYQSLYRRYRPGTFAAVRGQDHVVMALRNAVRDGRVAHAYLFSGPRGTGKTSTARILAKALNCTALVEGEPCGECESCRAIARGSSLDVHELDAASNNGVDAMRDLVSRAALGTPGRQKVYIVDEVHMLSAAASNALLKTLEEPPAHVVFVLATTDPQKVLPTIRSRTQHYEFRLLGAETLSELVQDIKADAGLDVSDDALSVAVRRGRGSARDTLSALDQLVAADEVDDDLPALDTVVTALANQDAGGALRALAVLLETGWSPQQLTVDLVEYLRQGFLAKVAPDLVTLTGTERERAVDTTGALGLPALVRAVEELGRSLVAMRDAPDTRVLLEVALVRLAHPETDDSTLALLHRIEHLEQQLHGEAPAPRPAPGTVPSASPAASQEASAGAEHALREDARVRALREARAAIGREEPATGPSGGPAAHAGAPEPAPEPEPTAVAESPAVDPEPVAAPSPPTPTVGAFLRGGPAPGEDDRSPEVPVRPQAAPSPVGGASGTASSSVTRDALVQAWGDHVLGSLRPKAKALMSAGRFLEMDGGVAVFALPNEPHRKQCEAVVPEVEAALGAHFHEPVRLRLAVDGEPRARAELPGEETVPVATGPMPGNVEPEADFGAFEEAVAVSGTFDDSAAARLKQAFPGAVEESVGGEFLS